MFNLSEKGKRAPPLMPAGPRNQGRPAGLFNLSGLRKY
jgi:hypothetical protein